MSKLYTIKDINLTNLCSQEESDRMLEAYHTKIIKQSILWAAAMVAYAVGAIWAIWSIVKNRTCIEIFSASAIALFILLYIIASLDATLSELNGAPNRVCKYYRITQGKSVLGNKLFELDAPICAQCTHRLEFELEDEQHVVHKDTIYLNGTEVRTDIDAPVVDLMRGIVCLPRGWNG